MKNFIVKTALCGFLGFSLAAWAAGTVVIRETPVMLTNEQGVYVVPAGSTANYYYYTSNNTKYICTRTAPSDLATVQVVPLNVRFGTETREVQCYPDTNFVVEVK